MTLPSAKSLNEASARGRFVITAGMQRSGTRWFCNMLVDIVGEVTCSGTRELRDVYGVHDLLQRYYTPTFKARFAHRRLRRLEAILADGHTLVFKTHRPPTAALRERIADGSAVATYLFRDPRDVILSALEQGAKMRAQGALPFRGFARLTSFDRAARWLERRLLPVWREWTSIDGVLALRYEDLLADPRRTMAKTLTHLGIAAPPDVVDRVVRAYNAANVQDGTVRKALDLDRGVADRPRIALTPDQQRRLQRSLEPALLRMGYLSGEERHSVGQAILPEDPFAQARPR
jgi:Sulfotransferase domain